tara:strand:- start:106 stop:381 length:276 start_codon:yes stop_codon:yes gene_type:complete
MKTNRIILILGILIFLVPFAGFPRIWEESFLVVAGIILVIFSSLNLWQRSILKRLHYHSKQQVDDMPQEEIELEITETDIYDDGKKEETTI